MATTVPGQVSSAVVGSTYQAPSSTAEAYYYKELDRKRQEREERNAQIRADQAAQQQAAQQAANQEKVRTAFNQLYGPQMQNAYHDQMVMSEGVPGTGVQGRGLGMAPGGQSRLSSGNMKPWSEPGSYTPQGGWYQLPQEKLNRALDNMWRMKTDPYMQVAGTLNPMGGLFPSVGVSAPALLPTKTPSRQTKNKPKEEGPQGIDWWKEQNQGGALLR